MHRCARRPTRDPPTGQRLLLPRVLTAAVLLSAFIAAVLWLDRALFAAVIAMVIGLAGYEWARLGKLGSSAAVAYAAACAVLCFIATLAPGQAVWVCTLGTAFWVLIAPILLARQPKSPPAAATLAVGPIVLVPAGFAAATLPSVGLLMLLGLTWVADTGAYAAGRAFGRHKLAPSISPGKTWEGVAGGAVACVIYAIIWAVFEPDLRARVQGLAWLPYLAATMLLFTLSVVGDLFESALKRQAGAKDSGRLLPGHGGVLDRVDSATATLPVGLLLMQAMGNT
jgi:phosphatidate cytidylyltransferase